MKKLLSLLILIICLITCNKLHVFTSAQQTNTDDDLIINTLYPDDITDYQNLDNLTSIASNNNFIAYVIDNSTINVIDISTKDKIIINDFTYVSDIKFINNNELIVVSYNSSTQKSLLYKIIIENTTYSYTQIISIEINNLKFIDIYSKDNIVYIGFIYTSNSDWIFEAYKIGSTTERIDRFTTNQFDQLDTAYALTISDTQNFILFKNTYDQDRILIRNYGDTSSTPLTNSIASDITLIDYYLHNSENYLLAVSQPVLYLFSLSDFSSDIDNITDVKINDIDVFENNFYLSDSAKKTITSYTLQANETNYSITQKSTLISSSHSDLGRFNNVSDIFISGNNIFLSDTHNDRIQKIDKDLKSSNVYSFDKDTYPHSLVLNSKLDMFIIKPISTTKSSLEKFILNTEKEYENSTSYTKFNGEDLGYISDTTISNSDVIYLIDKTNNKLICLNTNTNNGLQEKYVLPFEVDDDTKIDYLKGLNLLVILDNNKLYLFNPDNLDNNQEPIINTLELNDNCKDITCDTNSIFTLQGEKIYSISINNSNIMQISEKSLNCEGFSTISTIAFDIINRQMYAFDQNRQCVVFFECNLTENVLIFNTVKNNELLNSNNSPFAIKVINNGIIYDMPFSLGNHFEGIEYCIGIEQYSNYYRVLFESDNILKVGFLKIENADTESESLQHNTTKKLRVITTNLQVPIYKYPTILKYENQAIITSYIHINTYINVTYYKFPISIDSKHFYLYEKDGKIGYIFNADIVLDDTSNITNLHNNNASINAISEGTINVYAEDKTTILLTLNNDDRIYVDSFNKDSEYTRIIYKCEDLNIITGYVKTEYIQMDKLDNNKILLICILIISIIILITIVVSYIIIRKKKR